MGRKARATKKTNTYEYVLGMSHRDTDPKKCPVGACENRVLCGGKYAVGVDRGISDSPRQLVNQLQRDTACSTTDSR